MATVITDEPLDDSTKTNEDGIPERKFKTQAELGTSLLFDKEEPLNVLTQYLKGMKWTVTYFLQLVDMNDSLALPDINLSSTVQKYNRINDLIVNVQSPINQDDIANVTGEIIINAGFVPNEKDIFIATLTGGRIGLFAIDNVVVHNYNLHPIYYCNIKLHLLLDTVSDLYNDIVAKVVKEYYYDKDHLLDFSAPIILSTDYFNKINLKTVSPTIREYYLNKFIHREKNLLVLPTTSGIYTDTFLTDFVLKTMNTSENLQLNRLSRIDVELNTKTIWDIIINKDINDLYYVEKDIGFTFVSYGGSLPLSREISYMGIDGIVNTRDGYTVAIPEVVANSIPHSSEYIAPIKTPDDNYVLSTALYTLNIPECGLLEECLIQFLKKEVINTDSLNTLIKQYKEWDTKDQYYLIPILLVLIQDNVSRAFTSL